MSPAECRQWIDRAEAIGFDRATVKTRAGAEENAAVRNNARVMIDDKEWAAVLWDRMSGIAPGDADGWRSTGLNERFRVYRYHKYQSFKKHSDGKFQRSTDEESRFTFMVYLNEDYVGGSTNFDDFTVWPQTGMGLCFHHSVSHEGATVVDGVKYALRSDIMFKPA